MKSRTEFCSMYAVSVLTLGMGWFGLRLPGAPQIDIPEGALTDWISISVGVSSLALGWDLIFTPLKWTHSTQPQYLKTAIYRHLGALRLLWKPVSFFFFRSSRIVKKNQAFWKTKLLSLKIDLECNVTCSSISLIRTSWTLENNACKVMFCFKKNHYGVCENRIGWTYCGDQRNYQIRN